MGEIWIYKKREFNMISKIKISFVILVAGLFLSSCENSTQKDFANALSVLTGDDYRVVKKDTFIAGFIVLKNSNFVFLPFFLGRKPQK